METFQCRPFIILPKTYIQTRKTTTFNPAAIDRVARDDHDLEWRIFWMLSKLIKNCNRVFVSIKDNELTNCRNMRSTRKIVLHEMQPTQSAVGEPRAREGNPMVSALIN